MLRPGNVSMIGPEIATTHSGYGAGPVCEFSLWGIFGDRLSPIAGHTLPPFMS